MSLPDVVVLSPHLDDAALSIGALIARIAAGGRRVEVWTAYTDGPAVLDLPAELRVFGDYATRRDEDRRAMTALGAGLRWLDLRERIWRDPRPARLLDVFRTPDQLDGFAALPDLRAAIGAVLADPAVLVYAPLGVGNHHDHVEVAVATMQEVAARRAFDRVRFYEDVYALGGALRRRHAVTRRRMWRSLRSPAWASPRLAATLRAVALAAAGPGPAAFVPEAAAWRWTCVLEPVGEHLRAKLAAIAEYRSQVRELGGMIQVGPFIQRGHDVLGGEPIWHVTP